MSTVTSGRKRMMHTADVVRTGKQVIYPENMKPETAMDIIKKQAEFENQIITIQNNFEGFFVWDAARAFYKAMFGTFGFASAQAIPPTFFSDEQPPRQITVRTGPNKDDTESIPFGEFLLPLIEGVVKMGINRDSQLAVRIDCKRGYESKVQAMFAETERLLETDSIYRGKAVTIAYKDGEKMPDINFMQTGNDDSLILPDHIEAAIRANIWTVMSNSNECRNAGVPLKRSVLLHGKYGTGKTLTARLTADVAVNNKWTFVYLQDGRFLSVAYKFAMAYAPAVIFVEDCDRTISGQRDASIDTILNTVDGIDTKRAEIMLIMTTNHAEAISEAMRRPGRIDAYIEVTPPDAEAVKRLIQHYARKQLDGDLDAATQALAGQIPAVIREAVERAKLYAIASGRDTLTTDDVINSALNMKQQIDFLNGEQVHTHQSPEEKLGHALREVTNVDDLADTVDRLNDYVRDNI